ncbi:ABC transporter substrate-binding protein [Halomonas sp.]|uniref:ABC transporter substrate-binding protein n=1 Tax=Halomonas sp. TaxID=1486246 RepID=UPI003569E176
MNNFDSSPSRWPLLLRGALVAAGIVALSNATLAAAQDSKPPTINIGQIAPFTGSAAEFGAFYEDGAQLAVQQINTAAEEVFGGPIIGKLVTADSATLPTPAIEGARKLVQVNGVPAIIGGWSSGVTIAVAESVTIPSGVLQVANGATSPLLSVLPSDNDADLLFRTTSPDTFQGIVAAQLANGEIIDDNKYQTASTIYINNPYGQGLSNSFADAFKERGGKILNQVPHPEEVQPTYRSQLSAALKEDPDLLAVVSYPGHTSVILKEARDFFDIDKYQFVDGNKSEAVVKAVGADTLAGSFGTAPGQDPESQGYQQFSKSYKSEMNRDRIPPFTTSAYDAAIVIGLALAKAVADDLSAEEITGAALRDRLRPVSNSPGTKVTGGTQEGVTKALQMIADGQDIDYIGASGAVDFNDAGDVVTPMVIWKYTADGKIETVGYQKAEDIPEK